MPDATLVVGEEGDGLDIFFFDKRLKSTQATLNQKGKTHLRIQRVRWTWSMRRAWSEEGDGYECGWEGVEEGDELDREKDGLLGQ